MIDRVRAQNRLYAPMPTLLQQSRGHETMSRTPKTVVRDLEVARILNPSGDLRLLSDGALFVSPDGVSRALSVRANESETVLDASDRKLRVRTRGTSIVSQAVRVSTPGSISYRAGPPDEVSSVSIESAESGKVGTGDADRLGSYLETSADLGGADVRLGNDDVTGTESSINLLRSGRLDARCASHAFSIDGDDVVTIDQDALTIHRDLDVHGSLRAVTGSTTSLHVSDAIVQVASGSETEAAVSSSACGLSIDTVPGESADVAYMSDFTDSSGTPVFVDELGAVDVPAATQSEVFHKRFAHEVRGGARASGLLTTPSRANEPAWCVDGGSVRISRAVPGKEAGTVTWYTFVLRVTDAGEFEVSRIRRVLHNRSGTTTYWSEAPEFAVMQACRVAT